MGGAALQRPLLTFALLLLLPVEFVLGPAGHWALRAAGLRGARSSKAKVGTGQLGAQSGDRKGRAAGEETRALTAGEEAVSSSPLGSFAVTLTEKQAQRLLLAGGEVDRGSWSGLMCGQGLSAGQPGSRERRRGGGQGDPASQPARLLQQSVTRLLQGESTDNWDTP